MTRLSGSRAGSGVIQVWLDPDELFRRATGNEPLDWQRPYLRETRNSVVVKGRQVGASTSGSVLAIRQARLGANRLVAIVSPSQKQSTEVRERCEQGLERMKVRLKTNNSTTLELHNGSRIISLPGTAKSVRGWSAHFLILDEAAYLDPETFLAARATVAATGGRVVVQSTPEGPYGHFYDLFRESVDPVTGPPDAEWVRFQVSSEEVSTIDPDFLASEKATLTEDDYAQEYLGRFRRPGSGLVDPERLKALTLEPRERDADDPWARLR